MGTNYYAYTGKKAKVICNCGFRHNVPECLHIGKLSCGWYFTLQAIPQKGLDELEDWLPVLKKSKKIVNEYGEEISFDEMKKMILNLTPRHPNKEEKESLRATAQKYGYFLDESCWLFRIESKGLQGNYVMDAREFS